MLKVIKAGLFTTVQDLGRFGWRQFGFARSGAMDTLAASAANALLAQDNNTPVLECTLLGPTLEFQCDSVIAFSGATMSLHIDGKQQAPGQAIAIKRGQTLAIGRAHLGCRGYLAIKGGIDLKPTLDSVSFQSQVGIGCQLRQGQSLAIHCYSKPAPECHSWIGLPWSLTSVLALFSGPHSDLIEGGLSALCDNPWQMSHHANRIGIRLHGESLPHATVEQMPSEPVLPGTVQLPPNGLPLLLGPDSQATGGYPKIAQVAHSSLSTMAQLLPNQTIWFEPISLTEARKRQRRQLRQLKTLRFAAQQRWQQC